MQTFYECISNRLRTRCKHLVNVSLTPTKLPAKHSVNSPRPPRNWLRNTPSIPHVHHEIGCKTLRNSPRPPTKLVAKHSVRRRGPIHRARILTLPITHIRITKNAYPHYQLRVFISPRTHLCITIPIYSFFVVYNIEYKTTQYSIYIHVNCINCFLGYFLIKIQNRPLHSTLYICMHPNFVLASDRNCVPIILPIPSVEPRFISPLYRFHTQNGGKKHVHTEFSLPETVPNYAWTE